MYLSSDQTKFFGRNEFKTSLWLLHFLTQDFAIFIFALKNV